MQKDEALSGMAEAVRAATSAILAANALDMTQAEREGAADAFLDRLLLDETRVAAMALAIDEIAMLADPVGRVMARSGGRTGSSSSA